MSASMRRVNVARPQPAIKGPSTATEIVWTPLYRAGAGAALASAVLIVVAVAVFLLWPPPATAQDFLILLQRNPIRGLLDLDLLLMVTYLTIIPVYLAVYTLLRRSGPSLALMGLSAELLGIALILNSNAAFGMLSLSGQYAAASAAQRSALVAAGQALMATSVGSGFNAGYIAGAVGALLFSAAMLRDRHFSKATAYTGLAMGALMLIPATVGVVGLTLSLLSLAPTVVWLGLVGARLLRLNKTAGGTPA